MNETTLTHEAICQSVLTASKMAEENHLCFFRTGNFSERHDGKIYITPSGVNRMTMNEDDILILDESGKVLVNRNNHRPSSETQMHLEIYRANPEISAIAHTHSKFAKIFAALEKNLPVLVEEGMLLGKKVGEFIPVTKFAKAGTEELAHEVREGIRNSQALLLAKHGALCVDKFTLERAVTKAYYLEELAFVAYHCEQLKKNI